MTNFDYREVAPIDSLRPHVRALWRLTASDASPVRDRIEPILPDGCVEIVVHRADSFAVEDDAGRLVGQEHSLVVGPTTKAGRFARGDVTHAFGVRLEHGAARLLGLPHVAELRDRIVSTQALGSSFATRLCQALRGCDPNDLASVAQRMLRDQLALVRRSSRIDVVRALRDHASISRSAHAVGLSTRQFERIFASEVGMSPSRLRTLWRFQSTVNHLEAGTFRRLADLAQHAGYSDEAHLCREFKRHAGCTVREHLAKRGDLTRAFLGMPE